MGIDQRTPVEKNQGRDSNLSRRLIVFDSRLFKSKPVLALLVLSILSFMTMGSTLVKQFPKVIPLPDGFRPEGIATGKGSTFFVGSIPTGAIYRGDYRTGEGDVLVPPQDGRAAIGMKFDERTGLLFVAGGMTGSAFVYNGETGANVENIPLTSSTPTFINDVVITKDAAYFTDSSRPVLYRVPLQKNGRLPDPVTSNEIPLSGDFEFVPDEFNTNGIDATPNGKTLIIVNSTLGTLYTVDPDTGEATLLDLGGETVPNGDGILLHGKTLYVVQNFLNQIAVVELNSTLATGSVERTIKSPSFRIPTTIARFGNSLYAVNARFDTEPMPDTEYDVVQVPRR
jgi:sugar lactone lactonase YvrE